MNGFKKVLVMLTALLCASIANAQIQDTTRNRLWNDLGMFPKKDPSSGKGLQVSGFYRFFATYTKQNDPYLLNAAANETVLDRSLFIGDDSQLPNLSLTIAGRPDERASWSFDLMVFQFLQGNIGQSYGSQTAEALRPSIQNPLSSTRLGSSMGLLLGMNLHGSFKTKVGTLSTHLGGIQWYSMSDLTMASFRGYNRFMLFERNPWDPTGTDISSRYKQYFDQGSIDQDTRWGNRAFVGAVIEGADFPGRISFSALIGKTELNGGFSQVPNFSYGGKIKKDFGSKNFVSLNTINSFAYTDSLARENYGLHVSTLEWSITHKEITWKGEAGLGNYVSPINDAGWSELFQTRLNLKGRKKRPSIELHAYRISPDVVNNNAIYWNTATPEYSVNNIPAGSVGSSAVLQPFGSAMIRLGQLTNNRQGLNLNLEWGTKKLKFAGGIGTSSEIRPGAAVITYTHPVNQFTRARFWRWAFPSNVGPYNRYSDIFRDVYETVHLSDDSSGVVVNKKYFSVAELQVKYSTKIAGKDFYVFSLTQLSSAQRDFSALLVTSEKAYVRQYTSEIEAYLAVSRGVLINAYVGVERTIANYLTDIDEESRRPRNQYGEGYGVGCDIDMGKNARLYVRHRWYQFEDKNFALDRFSGHELTVEIKAFF
jgi:hypothetical protein